nr:hypothetical protein [Pirellula staleyi]
MKYARQPAYLAATAMLVALSLAGCTVMPHGPAAGQPMRPHAVQTGPSCGPGCNDCQGNLCGGPLTTLATHVVNAARCEPGCDPYGGACGDPYCSPASLHCSNCSDRGCERCRVPLGNGEGLTFSRAASHLRHAQEKMTFPVAPKSPTPMFHPVPARPVFEPSLVQPARFSPSPSDLLPAPVPTPQPMHEPLP